MAWAAVGSTAISVGGSLLGGWLGSKKAKKTPSYNYAAARQNLADYMGSSFDLYEDFSPQIQAERVDSTQGATQAVNFNALNLENFKNMAASINQSAVSDRLKMVKEVSPQWENQRDIADKTNMAMMKGEIPLDAQQAMARSNAYKSFQAGTSGTTSGRQGLLARDLGMTSINLMQRGQDAAQSWLKTNQQIAMPDQVGAGEIMSSIGYTAPTAIGVLEANANRELSADTTSKGFEWDKMQGLQDIYGTKLEVENALLSQQLADAWGKYQGQQAASQNLLSGIGGAVKAAATPYSTYTGNKSDSGNLIGSIASGIGGLIGKLF